MLTSVDFAHARPIMLQHSTSNNHMTILHSSLHKYILAVHDLHCIPRYIIGASVSEPPLVDSTDALSR